MIEPKTNYSDRPNLAVTVDYQEWVVLADLGGQEMINRDNMLKF